MSDPFDRLRDGLRDPAAPDPAAIRGRAARIVRRRQIAIGGAAAAIVVVAAIGAGLRPSGDTAQQLAGPQRQARTPAASARAAGDPAGAATTARRAEPTPAPAFKGQPAGSESGGSRPASSADGGARSSGEAPLSARDAGPAPGLEATVRVDERSVGAGRGVGFTLSVCNRTSGAVERDFSDAQRYDFEVSRGGAVVWRWSDGRFFAQSVGRERWAAGECKSWSERWDGTRSGGGLAAPGRYDVVGVLESSPPLRSAPRSFCLDAC